LRDILSNGKGIPCSMRTRGEANMGHVKEELRIFSIHDMN